MIFATITHKASFLDDYRFIAGCIKGHRSDRLIILGIFIRLAILSPFNNISAVENNVIKHVIIISVNIARQQHTHGDTYRCDFE